MMRLLSIFFLLVVWFNVLAPKYTQAHPMPNTIILLDVHESSIDAELQLPLQEFELAFGRKFEGNTAQALEQYRLEVSSYLVRHSFARTKNGQDWLVECKSISLDSTTTAINGQFLELRARLVLKPPVGSSVRDLVWHYDVILHQVVTHSALVVVRQDWEAGIVQEKTSDNPHEIGVIAWDIRSNTLAPFVLPMQSSSVWKGLFAMLQRGMAHIGEGIDHVLFLLVLLIPAPLLAGNNSWKAFGGWKYGSIRLLKVITAFTIGHSLTLLLGAFGAVTIPAKAVELCIAASILVSALHAVRPLFAGRELWIAAGFGLVHGLAFAESLQGLQLGTVRLLLAVGAFNLGIEIMQCVIMVFILPFLMLLAQTRFYAVFRKSLALLAIGAALAWGIERWSGTENLISPLLTQIVQKPHYISLLWMMFVLISVILWFMERKHSQNPDSISLVAE
ncbi:MAG: HupE/UreJ family protein [Candidatus Kapaibacterium sp.]|nr:MAG: HupE/UreJ family protein [Candidatus Kapabacteria bacterium]